MAVIDLVATPLGSTWKRSLFDKVSRAVEKYLPVSWHRLVNRPSLVAPPALPLAALEAVLRTALAAAVAHQGEWLMRAPLIGRLAEPNPNFGQPS